MTAAAFSAGISKTTTALKRTTGFVLFAVLLLGTWTHAPVSAMQLLLAQADSARHVPGADQGETPRPLVEQEAALKKRRSESGRTQAEAAPVPDSPQITANPPRGDETDRQRLDMTAQQARQCYEFSCQLMLSDPALRLHPGHAPPQFQPGSAG